MGPDYLFIAGGAVVVLVALAVLVRGLRTGSRKAPIDAALWACLAAGFFLQGFAPNLKVKQNAFVMPTPTAGSPSVSPKELVERDKTMKVLSALFTFTATVGLVMRYRYLFTSPSTPSGSESPAPVQPTETSRS